MKHTGLLMWVNLCLIILGIRASNNTLPEYHWDSTANTLFRQYLAEKHLVPYLQLLHADGMDRQRWAERENRTPSRLDPWRCSLLPGTQLSRTDWRAFTFGTQFPWPRPEFGCIQGILGLFLFSWSLDWFFLIGHHQSWGIFNMSWFSWSHLLTWCMFWRCL